MIGSPNQFYFLPITVNQDDAPVPTVVSLEMVKATKEVKDTGSIGKSIIVRVRLYVHLLYEMLSRELTGIM